MGACYTNVFLRSATCEQTLRALRKLRRLALVTSAGRDKTVVYDSKCEQQDTKFLCDLSAALSRELRCAAWGVLNVDDDALWYVLSSNGEIVDSYNSAPDYFEDSSDPAPPEGGDGEVLARLMGHPKSAAKLSRILRATHDVYDLQSDRHRSLCRALAIDFSRVSCGFDDLDTGRRHLRGLALVGESSAFTPAILKRARRNPRDGTIGVERPNWYRVAELDVNSGMIDIADLGAVPHEAIRMRLPRGKYWIEARLIEFDRCLKISRLRALPAEAQIARGPKFADLSVDFAAVAFGDFEVARKNLNGQQLERLNRWVLHATNTNMCAKRSKRFGANTVSLVSCQIALGDGTYPIHRLNGGRRAVGFEIEFIPNGHVWRSPRPTVKWARIRQSKIASTAV